MPTLKVSKYLYGKALTKQTHDTRKFHQSWCSQSGKKTFQGQVCSLMVQSNQCASIKEIHGMVLTLGQMVLIICINQTLMMYNGQPIQSHHYNYKNFPLNNSIPPKKKPKKNLPMPAWGSGGMVTYFIICTAWLRRPHLYSISAYTLRKWSYCRYLVGSSNLKFSIKSILYTIVYLTSM